MILIASVQHTGTWFMIDFVERVGGIRVRLLQDLVFNWRPTNALHIHTADEGVFGNDFAERLLPHLVKIHKTIIPLRDPVLSLITRQTRFPEKSHEYIIDGFEFLAGVNHDNVMFLPVDQQYTFARRVKLLQQLANHLQITLDNQDPLVEYARMWHAQHTSNSKEMRRVYYEHGAKEIPELESEVALLLSKPKIKEFLQRHDYSLPWFEKVGD